jgi:8-oxo-dGTP pyrophosphatase MutT (NUDIX family)
MKKLHLPADGAEIALNQFAALCYRLDRDGRTEILLITSRETGRWILPKGWPMPGLTGAKCALREAFEEAGVKGEVGRVPVGIYAYRKVMPSEEDRECVVTVYPVRVRALADKYPEQGQRSRVWVCPAVAADKVSEPELKTILAGFTPAAAAFKPSKKG